MVVQKDRKRIAGVFVAVIKMTFKTIVWRTILGEATIQGGGGGAAKGTGGGRGGGGDNDLLLMKLSITGDDS